MNIGMKTKILVAAVFAVILAGCVGPQDAEGWSSSQKNQFMKILASDKYLSLCDQRPLYEKIRQNQNSRLMTRLLVGYTDNLANSCIKKDTLGEGYDAYWQKVSTSDIQRKLRAGQSIEKILKPYVPEYKQFRLLLAKYKALQRTPGASPETLHKVRMSIERIKLMKPGLGKTYVLVNIPEFRVRIIENDKTSLAMGVITGKKDHQTPIFSERLQYIVLNPTWNVPDSIARNEVIPKLLKDPNYLKKHRLVMRKDYSLDSPALSPSSVNLRAYKGGKGEVPFKFIEVPSDKNALGRVKFIFPNHHSVYMHDTPTKYLFKRKVRAYSHGCVRLQDPKLMLKYLTEHYTNYSFEEAMEKYDSYKTQYMKIVKPLPVHTAYLTAYVEDDGTLKVFPDIYGLDRTQKLNF